MTQYIPFVFIIPGMNAQLNQDGSWTFIERSTTYDEDPKITEIAKHLATIPNNPTPDNTTPRKMLELYKIVINDPIVGEYALQIISPHSMQIGYDHAQEELRPQTDTQIDRYIGIYHSSKPL